MFKFKVNILVTVSFSSSAFRVDFLELLTQHNTQYFVIIGCFLHIAFVTSVIIKDLKIHCNAFVMVLM